MPPGHLENVTDGTNAHLVAIDANGALLASEAEIVSTRQGDQIREIFLDRSEARRPRSGARRPRRRRAAGPAGPLRGAPGDQPAGGRAHRERRPDHLRARHPALEPVPVVPHTGRQRGHRRQPARHQAADHQHPARRGDRRRQRRRSHRPRAVLPARQGAAGDAGAVPHHPLSDQRSGERRRRRLRAARRRRVARGSAAGADRQLRGRRHRPARRVEGPRPVHRVAARPGARAARRRLSARRDLRRQADAEPARDGARRRLRPAGTSRRVPRRRPARRGPRRLAAVPRAAAGGG